MILGACQYRTRAERSLFTSSLGVSSASVVGCRSRALRGLGLVHFLGGLSPGV